MEVTSWTLYRRLKPIYSCLLEPNNIKYSKSYRLKAQIYRRHQPTEILVFYDSTDKKSDVNDLTKHLDMILQLQHEHAPQASILLRDINYLRDIID